ncbi:hypothetical protein GS399_09050 [Pedobacter sp. HMF7647]|uniref:LiaF transmembrane domain-containing protein n=1 Tax=Hufsiella arboris TaxID=2695275 RepID=A0A7K1Y944_9SPHI|nr:DUF5668 domain-containing protein [Hufsiella arboris]MXV51114.1 hypothetical protein [Hufsiella arboris]
MNLESKKSQNGSAAVGFAMLTVGGILLANQMGANFPGWLISWPMLLIVLGIVSGIKHRFTKPGAFILLIIGTAFLLENYFLAAHISVLWPMLLIGWGVWVILKPSKQHTCWRRSQMNNSVGS